MADLIAEEILRDEGGNAEYRRPHIFHDFLGVLISEGLMTMGTTNLDDIALNCEEVEQALRYSKENGYLFRSTRDTTSQRRWSKHHSL